MELPKDMVATQFAEPCAPEDDYDDLCGADLSDEEILLSFLKEGCDLDGSPLLVTTECEPVPQPSYGSRTLH